MLSLFVACAAAVKPSPALVIGGATGRVGSAVVRSILAQQGVAPGASGRVYVLARDIDRAAELHGENVCCLHADYADEEALRKAFASISAPTFRLFLACSNGAQQAAMESNVVRSACAAGRCTYVVKLSTATPVLEMREGGPYAAHLEVESLLNEIGVPHAVLRPNLFMDEVVLGSFLGVADRLRTSDVCMHPFASSPISAVDTRDVGACAAALLVAPEPPPRAYYDLDGPSPICLGDELAHAISELRPRTVAIEACTLDDFLAPSGLPPSAASSLSGFLAVLQSRCAGASDAVLSLTGTPPRSVAQFVRDHASRLLPDSFERALGCAAASFRDGARVCTLRTVDELRALEADEVLIRTHVAGINGGADTFTLTNAPADASGLPLGKEGVGVAVAAGERAAAAGFVPGERVAFIGAGYSEYVGARARRRPVCPRWSRLNRPVTIRLHPGTCACRHGCATS